ncbi:MAG: hypothetical protein COZ31_01575 [Nitrospirae bacterium CG_4_10_14_3_um_filter_44_29]|nr:hypothetical protein [Nitrospirota bacterium]OIO29878.1 MAG: hypothetical protein AUJ60_04010 [Nitrospirae bacterium CG1_02_44_142]PIP70314.1 MAG: hypothetical protein COW90_05910 [Nitrospirae bacterium CG22_combo_CG10-13_8_21_14_all_44_11]PIV40024.1 MAG: hypothetical protein COS28_10990 [Nitrospirae bacterium CG02_land_8_20_14_3_00_44_33]PIV66112.1 MAG: hypothetical protein COS10_07935 [Nitrospirae bacterium CG01_land_8_20_14_3_00_44_22]PIW88971.1 MAG: hypothetical protein COZ93_07565 [Nit
MKAVEVSKEEVLDFLRLDIISEIRSVSFAIELFEKKYSKKFNEFEKDISGHEEKYEEWDDYVEWKAYQETYKDRVEKLKELDNAEDIKIIAG